MNRRVCVWAGSIVGAAVCGWALGGPVTPAWGQQAPPLAAPVATVPPAIAALYPTNNVAAAQAKIRPWMATELALLASPGNPVGQASARLSLMAACPRSPAASTSYNSAYSAELALQSVPLLGSTASDVRVRVAVGVVIGSVARVGQSTLVIPAIEKLLADPNPAVADCGMKAAAPIVVALITQQPVPPAAAKFFTNIVNSANAHSRDLSGFVAEDAYAALVVNPNNVPNLQPAAVQPLLKPLYAPVLSLLATRIGRYSGGLVPEPGAEQNVPLFLSRGFTDLTAPQQIMAVQELTDLVDAAGQRAVLAKTPVELRPVARTITLAASALNVMSATATKGANSNPVANIASLSLGATAPQVAAAAGTVFAEMNGPFPKLTPPPKLPAMAPPPAKT